MSSPLKQNTTTIQNLLNTINSLPDAGGVDLPELPNEGSSAELFAGKELIDGNGEKVTGTFTIDSELSTQDSLISQIQTALQNKASASEPALQTKTVTPTTSAQNVTPDSGYDGLSKVTVNAIPSTYVKPTSTKAATTYTPTTSNQTIAAGTYCSGVQTIKGDTNLKAENIAEGVSIFGITGTHSGGAVETCTGRVAYMDLLNFKNPFTPPCYYTGDDLSTKTFNAADGGTSITAIKGSLLYMADTQGGTVSNCENATLILSTSTGKLFSIDADEFRVFIDR